ncbi:hypothetical protein DD594_27710 [Enterobacter cloacae complex sp. 4DZ1-17B1]|nr:hypothetical protein DD594_27710 [Enterobacter cloacae complex sp. 4DZ1-17B1]
MVSIIPGGDETIEPPEREEFYNSSEHLEVNNDEDNEYLDNSSEHGGKTEITTCMILLISTLDAKNAIGGNEQETKQERT